MRVRWFMDISLQAQYDQTFVQFNNTPDLPAPPPQLLMEHFRQAVLANMKGAGKVQVYDIDPSEDAQSMSTFEQGEGKDYLELFLTDKLLDAQYANGNEAGNDGISEISTCVNEGKESEREPGTRDASQKLDDSNISNRDLDSQTISEI